jgi:hypothetical protein
MIGKRITWKLTRPIPCETDFSSTWTSLIISWHSLQNMQCDMFSCYSYSWWRTHRYANAVSLLERYVPVSGFINGLFGMVAGGACMVGPTAVAVLAKYTSLQ